MYKQEAHLDALVSHAHVVNDAPLHAQGRQALGPALLCQHVQHAVGKAVVGLPCSIMAARW